MHEMGIANSVLQAVHNEMRRYPDSYPAKVCVRIGEMAAVDQDSLRFCFEAITRETDFENLQLEVEICPLKYYCTRCGTEFVVRHYDVRCSHCASIETQCVSGDELELAYLEVEEYGPSAVGTQSTQRK